MCGYVIFLSVPLLLLDSNEHVGLGPDLHGGGDGESFRLNHHWVVVVLGVLATKPWMFFEIHCTKKLRDRKYWKVFFISPKFICILCCGDTHSQNVGIVVTVHARGPHHHQDHFGPPKVVRQSSMVSPVVSAHQERLLSTWRDVDLAR